MTAVKTKSVWTKENSAVYTSVGLSEWNSPLSLTAAVLEAESNMSVCDGDKVISSGVGHEPLLFHRITFHRGKRHRGGREITDFWLWTALRRVRTCAAMGRSYAIMNKVSVQVLYGFLLHQETGWGKEARKIASPIIAARKAFAAFVLIFVLSKLHDMTLMLDLMKKHRKVHFLS